MSHSIVGIPRHIQNWINQAAAAAERPSQAQLENLALQINHDAEYQSLVKSGAMQQLTGHSLDQIISSYKRVQQSRFDADGSENKSDRDARVAQRNDSAGFVDRFVTGLSENFHSHREATEEFGVGCAELDVAMIECQGERGLFNLRFANYPDAMTKLHDMVHGYGAQLHAEAAA